MSWARTTRGSPRSSSTSPRRSLPTRGGVSSRRHGTGSSARTPASTSRTCRATTRLSCCRSTRTPPRATCARAFPSAPGVIVSDTFGRAWRIGQVEVAIGIAGVQPVDDWRGRTDAEGRELAATQLAVADAIAAASSSRARRTPASRGRGQRAGPLRRPTTTAPAPPLSSRARGERPLPRSGKPPADPVERRALRRRTARGVRRGDQVLRLELHAVVGAREARDVLLHQRPAQVVHAPVERLGRGVEAHLHPARLHASGPSSRAPAGTRPCASGSPRARSPRSRACGRASCGTG